MHPKRIPLSQIAHWGLFIFLASYAAYILVMLIQLSSREETRYLAETSAEINYMLDLKHNKKR